MEDERSAPSRRIDKIEAIRHLIQASIRMHFWEEDPFAVHMIALACDRLISEYTEKKNIPVSFSWEDRIKPEFLKSFRELHRETYDYFRHSDKNYDSTIEVRNIGKINHNAIFLNVLRFIDIENKISRHTHHFMTYTFVVNPDYFKEPPKEFHIIHQNKNNFSTMTRPEMLALWRYVMVSDQTFQIEIRKDLLDLGKVADIRV